MPTNPPPTTTAPADLLMPPRVEPGARAHLKPCIGFGIRTAILAGIVLFPPMAATGLTGTFDDPISIVSIDGYTTCCLPD